MAEFAHVFSPVPGINTDDTTFASPGRYVDSDNARFRMGKRKGPRSG